MACPQRPTGDAVLSRAPRLLALLQSLRRRRAPVTAAALAAELGVSVRTVYRDVATLKAEGAPVGGEAGMGYVLEAGFFLPPLALGGDEVEAVVLGLRFAMARGDPELVAAAEGALAKIIAVLPSASAAAAAASALLVGPPARSAHDGRDHIARIRRALRAEIRLTLAYRDAGGIETVRTIWPVALGLFDHAVVLAAWCEARGAFRHFRLDRILSVADLPGRMPRPRRVLMAEWRLLQGLRDRP